MNKQEIISAIEEQKKQIARKIKEIDNFELDPDDYEDQYRDAIEEFSGPVRIGTLEYSAAHVLEEVDPTAYRCGLNDFVDSLDIRDDPKHAELCEELEEMDAMLSDLESSLEEMEMEEEEEEEPCN